MSLVLNCFKNYEKKNPNLTAEQKLVMFEDGTEPPGSSELNNEKEMGAFIVLIVELNYLSLKQNMKVDLVGPHFFNPYQMFLKRKQII